MFTAIIYFILNHETNKIYIGSTTMKLKDRIKAHKHNHNSRVYREGLLDFGCYITGEIYEVIC